MTAEPEWRADPGGGHELRYWDGAAWTEHVSDNGVGAVDPYVPKDPDLLWEGRKHGLGIAQARYRITRSMIHFEAGTISTKAEQVPLWAVRDIDVRQSVTQKARSVGDLRIRVRHDDYTGRQFVMLESFERPQAVRDLLNEHSEEARREHQNRAATSTIQHVGTPTQAGMGVPAAPSSQLSIADELKKFAELRDAGVLTEEEFAAQKARLPRGVNKPLARSSPEVEM